MELVCLENGCAEELACEIAVLVAVVFWQQGLLYSVFLLKTLDCLYSESIYDVLVVVPIEALVLEQFIEFVVVPDECLVDFSPHLAVVLVGVDGVFEIVLEKLCFPDSVIEPFDKVGMKVPRHFLAFEEFAKHTIVFQLERKPVVGETCRWPCECFPACLSFHHLLLFPCLFSYRDHERQHIIIKVVGFGKAEDKFLFRRVDIIVAILIVSIGELNYLYPYQFSINHNFFMSLSFFVVQI